MQPEFSNSCHNFLGLSSFSYSDFWPTSHLSDCSMQFLRKSHVAPKNNKNLKIFIATHFGTGLAAKKMEFLVLKDN